MSIRYLKITGDLSYVFLFACDSRRLINERDYIEVYFVEYHDLPEDADSSFFLCKELIPGYLDDVTGVYQTPQGYYVKDENVDEFDKEFPPKEKLKLPGQIFG